MSRPSFLSGFGVMLVTLCLSSISFAAIPSVSGTVTHEGAAIGDVQLALYADDGDMTFDINLDTLITSVASGIDGEFAFDSLDASTNYFVYQGAQTVGSLGLIPSTSNLVSPVVDTMLVDAFQQQQRVEGNPIVTTGALNLSASSILGGQRDIRVDYISGPAEVVLHANPWGLNQVLQFDQSAGSMGIATITWDGLDSDMTETPAADGLGGIDLTADGGEAFSFMAGIDEAGNGDSLTFRVFSGSDVSFATVDIPVTNGTAAAQVYVPFSDFVGDADFTSIDAIQAAFGGQQPSIDAQLGAIYVVAGGQTNLSVATPEPAAMGLALTASLAALAMRRRR